MIMPGRNNITTGNNIDFERRKEFVKRLLQWYTLNKRIFSWRKRRLTPYQVLILELMLQRTPAERVERVLDEFLRKFPDPMTLSMASDKELESTIQTLGLQKRRRAMFKKLAEYLVKNYNGNVPMKGDELLQLPGVGIYVANAVLCYCYEEPVPLIDTNVARVLGRVFGLPFRDDPSSEKHLWVFARTILPKRNAKNFNWALIDFGSLVCKPRNPRCFECPMHEICKWHAQSPNLK
jgi:A/G-specific adenine glycosylase